MTRSHLCARCGHPIAGHLLADDALAAYCCHFTSCACRARQSDPVHTITAAEFTHRFPDWPAQLRSPIHA